MGLYQKIFKSKYEKELEALLGKVIVNMSNNYKDAAQEDFAAFEKAFCLMKDQELIKGKTLDKYEKIYEEYKVKLTGYTHKDQKPYWT